MQRILGGRNVDAVAKEMAYAEWVQGLAPWNTFFTGTFRAVEVSRGGFTVAVGKSEPSASRCFKRFVARQVPGARAFYGIDPNPARDGHHVHGLMVLPASQRRKELWKAWYDKHGVNRIEPIKAIGGVSGYCAKYPLSGARWWDIANFLPPEPNQKPECDLMVNCSSRLAARRSEADRLIERWGPTSKPAWRDRVVRV